jgi:hypothetical protein
MNEQGIEYPEYILAKLRQRQGLDENDTSEDDSFISMDPDQVFDEVCNWEGLIGYGETIREWISDIYGVNFDNYRTF